ncbi:hypothetical protein D9757_007490 [Collybiopsis confluens]|uniref:Phosphatidate phosphatase APP1 catalytic domain-containing protein n=1 Tax=Collybiopsis confluens TaxID=2823264 RepID=A0A8H5HJR0_9AGAR|nr:hypothetical protein D9757_007490 [Collybiopsis confluens]
MSSSSWHSKLNSLKTYVAQQTPPELRERAGDWKVRAEEKAGSFKGWAEQRYFARRGNGGMNEKGTTSRSIGNGDEEKLWIFPGWVTTRPAKGHLRNEYEWTDSEIEVHVSGFVSKLPSSLPTNGASASTSAAISAQPRSTKAFIRLAKSFAGLPKLDPVSEPIIGEFESTARAPPTPLSRSTENLLLNSRIHLPPKPGDISDDYSYQDYAEEDELDEEALERIEREFERLEAASASSHSQSNTSSNSNSRSSTSSSYSFGIEEPSSRVNPSWSPSTGRISNVSDRSRLHKLHKNLEQRLHPFWGSALPERVVRVSVYMDGSEDHSLSSPKLALTSADGSFESQFTIDTLTLKPGHIRVLVELLPKHCLPSSVSNSFPPTSNSTRTSPARSHPQPQRPLSVSLLSSAIVPTISSWLSVPLPLQSSSTIHGSQSAGTQLRLISDIDDTIKHTNVTGGSRTAFYNVFVRDLEEVVIAGMPEWYQHLERKGVKFSYVSNAPLQLLPVIRDFLEIANLPKGSLKLRSYTSKFLLSGLFSGISSWTSPFANLTGAAQAPPDPIVTADPAATEKSAGDPTNKKSDWATRKRSGVQEMLDAFCESKFILVGDSGEADLEVYTELARERPEQIEAIFIRDVGVDDGVEPLDDPTGSHFRDFASRSEFLTSREPGFAEKKVEGDAVSFKSAPPNLELAFDKLIAPHPPFASAAASHPNSPSASSARERSNPSSINTAYNTYASKRTSKASERSSAGSSKSASVPTGWSVASSDYFFTATTSASGSNIGGNNGGSGRNNGTGPRYTIEPEPLSMPAPSPSSTNYPSSATRMMPVTPMTPVTPRTPWTTHANSSLSSLNSIKSTTSASISNLGSTLGARLNLNKTSGGEGEYDRLQRLQRQEPVKQQRMEERVQVVRERKRAVLQARVHAARALVPRRTALRVFRDPRECYDDCARIGV